MPLEYQPDAGHAVRMKILCRFLLLSVPAFADWTIRYRSGEELLNQGRTEEAIQELQAARAERPDQPVILDALGRAGLRAGRYRQAKRYFDEAARIPGAHRAVVLTNMAIASIGLGDCRRAEVAAREAVALDSGSVESWAILAQSLQLQDRFVEAKAILQRTLAVRRDPAMLSDLANIYRAEHEYGKAMDLLEQAVAGTIPGQARARILTNLGFLQGQSGMREASLKSLRAALTEAESSIGPNHPDTAKMLEIYGEALRRSGQKAESRQVLQRAAAIRGLTGAQTNGTGFTVDWRDLGRK